MTDETGGERQAPSEPVISIESIRAAVAARHRLVLDDGDPVLVTVTLCEEVLKAYLGLIERSASRLELRSAGLLAQELELVRKQAETMIAGAAGYFKAEVIAAGEATKARLVAAVEERIANSDTALREALAARTAAIYAAIAAGGAALLAIGVAMGGWMR